MGFFFASSNENGELYKLPQYQTENHIFLATMGYRIAQTKTECDFDKKLRKGKDESIIH